MLYMLKFCEEMSLTLHTFHLLTRHRNHLLARDVSLPHQNRSLNDAAIQLPITGVCISWLLKPRA